MDAAKAAARWKDLESVRTAVQRAQVTLKWSDPAGQGDAGGKITSRSRRLSRTSQQNRRESVGLRISGTESGAGEAERYTVADESGVRVGHVSRHPDGRWGFVLDYDVPAFETQEAALAGMQQALATTRAGTWSAGGYKPERT